MREKEKSYTANYMYSSSRYAMFAADEAIASLSWVDSAAYIYVTCVVPALLVIRLHALHML